MNFKKGISLIVLVITLVIVVILAAAVILALSGSNPIYSSRIAKVATSYDNMRTDLELYVSNVKAQTKSYFTTEEILTGTGSVRKGIKFTDNDKIGTNSDETSNAEGYKVVLENEYIVVDQNEKNVFKIDKTKYEQLVNTIPEVPTSKAEWYIDLDLNVYLVYDSLDEIPKWLRGKATGNTITDDVTLASFLGVRQLDAGAKTVANSPTEYYGKSVTNYSANGISDWKIFHSDGNNIYLISTSYLTEGKIPLTKYGKSLGVGSSARSPNGVNLTNAARASEYKRETNYVYNIEENNPARKWLAYLNTTGITPDTTHYNMKAVAYLMDTDAWSIYKDSTYAYYAIGGPTLDLFAAAYNNYSSDSSRTIDIKVENSTGYVIKWNTESDYSSRISGINTSDFSSIWKEWRWHRWNVVSLSSF